MKKILLFILSGAAIVLICFVMAKNTYDNNEKIAKTRVESEYYKSSGYLKGNVVDIDIYFTGIETLWEINSQKEESINLDTKMEMKDSKFKLVVVNSNKKVTNLAEGNFKGKIEVPLTKGKNEIKMVGKNSNGKLFAELEEKDGIQIEEVNLFK